MYLFNIRMINNQIVEIASDNTQMKSVLEVLESSDSVKSFTVHGSGVQISEVSKEYFRLSGFTKLKDRNF